MFMRLHPSYGSDCRSSDMAKYHIMHNAHIQVRTFYCVFFLWRDLCGCRYSLRSGSGIASIQFTLIFHQVKTFLFATYEQASAFRVHALQKQKRKASHTYSKKAHGAWDKMRLSRSTFTLGELMNCHAPPSLFDLHKAVKAKRRLLRKQSAAQNGGKDVVIDSQVRNRDLCQVCCQQRYVLFSLTSHIATVSIIMFFFFIRRPIWIRTSPFLSLP